MQPESNGLSNHAKSVPALDAGRGLFRAKSPLPAFPTEAAVRVRSPSPPKIRSPVKVPERFKSPEPPPKGAGLVQSPEPEPTPRSNGERSGTADKSAANGDLPGPDGADEGFARRKVAKVVRRVVKKVLAPEKSEAAAPSAGSRSAPAAGAFSFKHDSIRTEDDVSQGLTSLMVRGRTREPRARPRRDERPEKLELDKINENRAEPEQQRGDASHPGRHALQRPSPAPQEVQPPAGIPTKSRPASLPPVFGFLPPPKAATLSPPPGFIPAPKPATRKLTPTPQKPGSGSALPHHTPTPPPSRPGPPSPPAGQSAVSQLEVERLSENTRDVFKRMSRQANPSVSDLPQCVNASLPSRSSISISMPCATSNPHVQRPVLACALTNAAACFVCQLSVSVLLL